VSIGQTKRIARAIAEVLRPLTGTPATGFATVTASGSDILLPAGSFAAPIRTSTSGTPPTTCQQIDRENLVRTTVDVIATTAGTTVPVTTMLGGIRQNLAALTSLRWDPPLIGMAPLAAVGAAALAGGANATGTGAVGQIVLYEELRSGQVPLDLFRARAESGAPLVAIVWSSRGRAEKVGRNRAARPETWQLFVVVGHQAGAPERGSDGLDVCDAIEGYLTDRAEIGGFIFSAPPASVTGCKRVAVNETGYVYAVELVTLNAAERIPTPEEATAVEWDHLRLDMQRASVPPFPVTTNALYDMLMGGFDHGFDHEGFDGA